MFQETNKIKLLSSNNIKRVSLPLLIIVCSSPVCFSATSTTRHNHVSALLRSNLNSSQNSSTSFNETSSVSTFVPNLTNGRLQDIREYDRMKCFPRLLCTLTKSDAFKKLGEPINLNELADGYMKLLSAFPGGPPTDLFTQSDGLLSFKDDFLGNEDGGGGEVGLNRFSSSEDQEEESNESKSSASDSSEERKKKKQQQQQKTREGNKEESEEMLLTDPLLHQKEKLEMKKLMDELIEEEKKPDGAEASSLSSVSSWSETIPKIGAHIIKSLVIPYLIGDEETKRRKRRDLFSSQFGPSQSRRIPKNNRRQEQTAIKVAMNLWTSLKSVKQCKTLYPSCPFEAWEVVSMISLITPKE